MIGVYVSICLYATNVAQRQMPTFQEKKSEIISSNNLPVDLKPDPFLAKTGTLDELFELITSENFDDDEDF